MSLRQSAIRDELLRLAEKYGRALQPAEIVGEARAEASPLHGWFDWDDSEAAAKWRLHQARQLVVTVQIEWPEAKDPIRAFVSLKSDRESSGGYRMAVDVLSDPERRAELLADARSDMLTFRAKYRALSELAAVFEAMEAAERQTAA